MQGTPLSTPVITVRGVSKRYGHVVAVDHVTLDVQPGEIYALLGLNGAGKTTLIRLLLGMVRPTAGDVEVTNRRVTDRAVWSQVGYLVETPSAYPELTVRENLEVVRRLRKIPDRGAVEDAIDLFGLRSYADRRARTLSLGNGQRLGLAKAFFHRPSLLVLDEPVNGLDPAGVVEVRTLLVNLARERGVTVFLSSHRLAEVARVAPASACCITVGSLTSSPPTPWHRVSAPAWRWVPGTPFARLGRCVKPASRHTTRLAAWSWRTAGGCATPSSWRRHWYGPAYRPPGSP